VVSGLSLNSVAARLNRDGHRTAQGRRWHAATVARLIYRVQRWLASGNGAYVSSVDLRGW
jgi:hypothetical protein